MKSVMRKEKYLLSILSLLILSGVLIFLVQGQGNVYGSDEENTDVGEKVYETRCLICHGSEGDGKGLVGVIRRGEKNGRILEILPRDFTLGVFRFRTTATGCLPDDSDFMILIDNGIPRSFMPSHKEELSPEEKKALIEYVKTFSERFEEEDPCDVIVAQKPDWVGSSKSIDKGKKIYKEMKCWECHGYEGKGDGPKSEKLKDDWGNQILPFNFATGDLKRGSSPENVYLTFTTGLDGTGMPSYEDSLDEEGRWHLVSYTLKLMGLTGGEKH